MSNNSNKNENKPSSVKEPEVVATAEKAFADYFETTGRKSFKQFYYDWHIDAMIEALNEFNQTV